MNNEDKITLIKEHQSDTIAGLNALLDRLYELKEYTNEHGEIKTGLEAEDQWKNYVLSMAKDTTKYEKLRRKVLNNDFNFTTAEINDIALVYFYLATSWTQQIELITKAKVAAEDLFKKLTKPN